MPSPTRRRPLYYILEGKMPVPCDSITWHLWFEGDDDRRVVAQTELPAAWVSTVFIGVDTAIGGPPVLFETMVDRDGRKCFRKHVTWEEAEAAHWELVKRYVAPLN